MNITQIELLELIEYKKINNKSLREIGKILLEEFGEKKIYSAQTIKFHLDKLEKENFINWDRVTRTFEFIEDRDSVIKNQSEIFKKVAIDLINSNDIYNFEISKNRISFLIR